MRHRISRSNVIVSCPVEANPHFANKGAVKAKLARDPFHVTIRHPGYLDLTHRDHLLAQVVLVFSNRTVPPSDRFVLAYHDILGNFVQQPTPKSASLDTKPEER